MRQKALKVYKIFHQVGRAVLEILLAKLTKGVRFFKNEIKN